MIKEESSELAVHWTSEKDPWMTLCGVPEPGTKGYINCQKCLKILQGARYIDVKFYQSNEPISNYGNL